MRKIAKILQMIRIEINTKQILLIKLGIKPNLNPLDFRNRKKVRVVLRRRIKDKSSRK